MLPSGFEPESLPYPFIKREGSMIGRTTLWERRFWNRVINLFKKKTIVPFPFYLVSYILPALIFLILTLQSSLFL